MNRDETIRYEGPDGATAQSGFLKGYAPFDWTAQV